jgi:anaerobic carbon-monoxide dehydrogenase iron sulfur subunit
VTFHEERCVGCENCRRACPFGAVFWDESIAHPMICVYCGLCARHCPYDVLAFEETGEGTRDA